MEEAKNLQPGEPVELEEMNVIIKVPKDVVRITMNCTVFSDGMEDLLKVEAVLGREDIRQARQDFLDNVEDGDDYDALYCLTDAGRALLENNV